MHFSHLSYVCVTCTPSNYPQFDHSNTLGRAIIMNLLIMQFSAVSCFMQYSRNWPNTCTSFSQKLPLSLRFMFSLGMRNQNNIIPTNSLPGGAQLFQKFRSHLKILGSRKVTWSKFRNDDPQTLGVTILNLHATATRNPGFVHSWLWLSTNSKMLATNIN